jgi:hypothetical protein
MADAAVARGLPVLPEQGRRLAALRVPIDTLLVRSTCPRVKLASERCRLATPLAFARVKSYAARRYSNPLDDAHRSGESAVAMLTLSVCMSTPIIARTSTAPCNFSGPGM